MSEVETPFFGNLVAAARENPLAAAFIGFGAFWLVSGASVFSSLSPIALKAANAAASGGRKSVESGRAAVDRVSAGAEGLTSATSDALGTLRNLVPDGQTVAELRAQARSTLTDVLERQPLALGLLGLVAGSLLAAALPPTEREAELMSAASAQAKADLRRRAEAVTPLVESGARDLSREAGAAASELTAKAQQAGADALKAGREKLMKGPTRPNGDSVAR